MGNDYLERTLSIADGEVGTVRFLNKISGRTYTLRGNEFEMKLTHERVGYDFGNENPPLVTRGSPFDAASFRTCAVAASAFSMSLAAPTTCAP